MKEIIEFQNLFFLDSCSFWIVVVAVVLIYVTFYSIKAILKGKRKREKNMNQWLISYLRRQGMIGGILGDVLVDFYLDDGTHLL